MLGKSSFTTPGMEYIFIFVIGMLLSIFPALVLFIFLGAYSFFLSFCFLILLTLLGCGFGIWRNLSLGEAKERDLEIARRIAVWFCVVIAVFCIAALVLAASGYFNTFFDLLDSYMKTKAAGL